MRVECGSAAAHHKEVKQLHSGLFMDSIGISHQLKGGYENDDGYETRYIQRVGPHLRMQSLFSLQYFLPRSRLNQMSFPANGMCHGWTPARNVRKRVGLLLEMNLGLLRLYEKTNASAHGTILMMKRFVFHNFCVNFDLCALAIACYISYTCSILIFSVIGTHMMNVPPVHIYNICSHRV